jgi:hypothetical protein
MTPPVLDLCPSCQAPHGPGEAFCWMCHHKFWNDPAAQPKPQHPPKAQPPAQTPSRFGSSEGWTQPFLVAAFILILTGLAMGRGAGTALLWLGLTPAFLITAMAGFKAPKTQPTTTLGKIERFVTKAASTVAIMILVIIGIIIALMAVCLAIVAVMK